MPDSHGHGSNTSASATALDTEAVGMPSGKSRFGLPLRERDVQAMKESCMPRKVQNNSELAQQCLVRVGY